MERESLFGRMEVIIKDNSIIIILKGTENTNDQTDECTEVIGKIIKCMEKDYSYGLMVKGTKEIIPMIRKMDSEFFNGQMAADMKEIGNKVNSMERELFLIKIEEKQSIMTWAI